MGYSTDFIGHFSLDRPLTPEHAAYLTKFAETRRMKRNAIMLENYNVPDPVRWAVDLEVGVEGAYFVGGTGDFGQGDDPSVLDHNIPPLGQPGLWCQWVPTQNLKGIEWDGGEKFYDYVEWLNYIIAHFLKPWGYVLNGKVRWEGEDREDMGTIWVNDNVVLTKQAVIDW